MVTAQKVEEIYGETPVFDGCIQRSPSGQLTRCGSKFSGSLKQKQWVKGFADRCWNDGGDKITFGGGGMDDMIIGCRSQDRLLWTEFDTYLSGKF